jgi:hypothetical protein
MFHIFCWKMMSHITVYVTDYNGFCIGWLYLLTPSLESLLIAINYNSSQSTADNSLDYRSLISVLLQPLNRLNRVRARVRLTLRLEVYRQSVRHGAEALETHSQNLFSQMNTCGDTPYITSSLTRGWVCHLQLLLVLASHSFSDPSPVGLTTIFYWRRFEISLLVASYDSRGHCGGIRTRLHTGYCSPSEHSHVSCLCNFENDRKSSTLRQLSYNYVLICSWGSVSRDPLLGNGNISAVESLTLGMCLPKCCLAMFICVTISLFFWDITPPCSPSKVNWLFAGIFCL